MRNLDRDTILALCTFGIFFLVYIFTFPTGWLISDEYSYINQGLSISQNQKVLTYIDGVTGETIPFKGTSYPLGNSFWIAIWIIIMGTKYTYLGSIICVLLGSYFLLKTLEKLNYQKLSIFLVFLFPSLAFISKSFMSSLPSFLIVSAFLLLLFTKKESGRKWMILSFLAALSFWFRETNLILLGGISLFNFFVSRKWFFHYALGALLGFLPRMLSAYHYYDDAFFWVLAEHFKFQNLINNLTVYFIILMVFMPASLVFLFRYKGPFNRPIIIASSLYILAYLFYGYNATEYSGFKNGVILMGRFLIPLLPIYIIAVGWAFRKNKTSKLISYGAFIITSFAIIIMQLFVHQEAKLHKTVSDHIYDNYGDKMILYDLSRRTNIVRYINPFQGELDASSDVANLNDKIYMRNLFAKFDEAYVIQSVNTGNQQKALLTSEVSDIIDNVKQYYQSETVEIIPVKASLEIKVIKISPKDE